MHILIRKYKKEDRAAVIRLLDSLKDFITSIDLWETDDRKPGYGSAALNDILKKREVIYVAQTKEGKIVGFSAVTVLKKDRLTKLASKSGMKSGEVTDLYVDSSNRRNNIGSKLMARAESYLKEQGCTHIEVGMFWPNKGAHKFYKDMGYDLYNATYIKRV